MNLFLKFLIQAALHIHLSVNFQKTLTSDTKAKQLRRERALPELLFLAYCHSGHSRLRRHRGPMCKTLDPLFPLTTLFLISTAFIIHQPGSN